MDEIIKILAERGPLTGKELLREVPLDEFALWAACRRSEKIFARIVGKRYLRLDIQVEGYARLSPSIMREFYGYTVLGMERDMDAIARRAAEVKEEMARISKKKFSLAQKTMAGLVEEHESGELIRERAAFLIAGDVVYGMAHGEPRPESSSGELVKGSDLDIIVVTQHMPPDISEGLDAAIYREKHRLLMHPALREEIDSIIKDISRVQEQLRFRDFKSMVASKILYEAYFLYGSRDIFARVKEMLGHEKIPEKIRALEKKAAVEREAAEAYLLQAPQSLSRDEAMKLFHTAEEKEEIF